MWPANASALEAVWTALACGGLAFALWLFGMIWRSYRAVCAWIEQERAVKWGPRHKFVLGFLVGIGVLVLVWAGFVVLGVNALENAPPPPNAPAGSWSASRSRCCSRRSRCCTPGSRSAGRHSNRTPSRRSGHRERPPASVRHQGPLRLGAAARLRDRGADRGR